MRLASKRLVLMAAALVASSLSFAQDSNDINSWPDWQKHAYWCAILDNGSSHKVYMSFCSSPGHDQFDAVVACQQDSGNGGAILAVQTAGRDAVNQFMQNHRNPACHN
jgi:hypothetical protein